MVFNNNPNIKKQLANDFGIVGNLDLEVNPTIQPIYAVVNRSGFPTPTNNQEPLSTSNGKTVTAVVAATGVTLYTVPTGKTLYVTGFGYLSSTTTPGEIRDGSLTGTLKFNVQGSASNSNVLVFPCPVKFTGSVFLDVGANTNVNWYINGWLE